MAAARARRPAPRGRAAATGTAKNRVPARATATSASPRVLTACTQARRSRGREDRERGDPGAPGEPPAIAGEPDPPAGSAGPGDPRFPADPGPRVARAPRPAPSMTRMLTAKPPGDPGASPIPGVGQLGRLLLAGQLGRRDVDVGGLVQRAEGDLAVLGVDHDHLAGGELLPQELLGQRVLDHSLDGPAQRPGPEGGVVALLGQQVLG